MSNVVYGVLGCGNGFIQVSKSERGAKMYATLHNHPEVYAMHLVSWAVWPLWVKHGKKWVIV